MRKYLIACIAALALCVQTTPSAQTFLQRLDLIQAQIDSLRAEYVPPPPPLVPPITTMVELKARLAGAADGDAIELAPTLDYPELLTVRKSVTLYSPVSLGRMDENTTVLPKFRDGVVIAADNVTLRGLEIHKVYSLTDIVTVNTDTLNGVLDRNRILGDPVNGAKRGIAANGTNLSIVGNWIDECFGPYPGSDTQAILIWNTPGPVLIENNFLRGGSETLMTGGADPVDAAHIPANVTVRGNTLTKRIEWKALPINVKNILEFKNVKVALVENNILEYSWGGHGQTGYAIALTPRNQSNTCPTCTVEDVTIRNNDIAHASGVLTVLGTDNIHPSGRLSRILFQGNRATDIDPVAWSGDNKMLLLLRGPLDFTISGNTFAGKNIGSWLYFDNLPAGDNITVTGNTIPPSRYGVFSSQGANTWAYYVVSGLLSNNVVVP